MTLKSFLWTSETWGSSLSGQACQLQIGQLYQLTCNISWNNWRYKHISGVKRFMSMIWLGFLAMFSYKSWLFVTDLRTYPPFYGGCLLVLKNGSSSSICQCLNLFPATLSYFLTPPQICVNIYSTNVSFLKKGSLEVSPKIFQWSVLCCLCSYVNNFIPFSTRTLTTYHAFRKCE